MISMPKIINLNAAKFSLGSDMPIPALLRGTTVVLPGGLLNQPLDYEGPFNRGDRTLR